ncbi:uncharacterized protein ISCGN_026786 [Ixodes scapularis]
MAGETGIDFPCALSLTLDNGASTELSAVPPPPSLPHRPSRSSFVWIARGTFSRFVAMPDACSAVGCSKRRGKENGARFFRFPSSKTHKSQRKKWIAALRRVNPDGTPWQPTRNARICGAHFHTGEPARLSTHPDHVPSIFSGCPARDGVMRRHKRADLRGKHVLAAIHQPGAAVCLPEAEASSRGDSMNEDVDDAGTSCTAFTTDNRLQNGDDAGTSCRAAPHDFRPQNEAAEALLLLSSGSQEKCLLQEHIQSATDSEPADTQLPSLDSVDTRLLQAKLQAAELALANAQRQADYWKGQYERKKAQGLGLNTLEDPQDCQYYTGLPSSGVFYLLFGHLEKDRNAG